MPRTHKVDDAGGSRMLRGHPGRDCAAAEDKRFASAKQKNPVNAIQRRHRKATMESRTTIFQRTVLDGRREKAIRPTVDGIAVIAAVRHDRSIVDRGIGFQRSSVALRESVVDKEAGWRLRRTGHRRGIGSRNGILTKAKQKCIVWRSSISWCNKACYGGKT